MEPAQALQGLDLLVGRVTGAEPLAGARGPSALLTLELGARGDAQASLPIAVEDANALVGQQIVCALGRDDIVVLAVHSHGSGVIVVVPAQPVEDGSPVA